MKREKLVTFLWSSALAFCMSFGAVGCMVSGFQMQVGIWVVALWCACAALLCSLCYQLPLGLLPPSVLALVSGVLWQRGLLDTSIESLLYRISRQYHQAYRWGVLKLNYLTADEMELRLWLILCLLGVVVAMLTAWAVCRRKTALPGSGLGLLMLATCLVVTDTVPGVLYLFFILFALLMLMLTNTVRRQEEGRGNRLTGVLAIPVMLCLLVLFAAIPRDQYTGAEAPRVWMDKLLESEFVTEVLGITPETGTSGSSVDSGVVNLQTVGVRVESTAEVMQVLTDFDGRLYLRGRALDSYNGKTWTDSGISAAELYWPKGDALAQGGEVMITTRYAHRMLYLPYYVRSKNLTEVTKGLENTKKLTQYSFSCDTFSATNDIFKIYSQVPYEDAWDVELSRYLHLDDSVWKWAEPLAMGIVEGKVSVYDKAQAIGEYVRSSATYSTNTYRMPAGSKDFVRWFLEDSETGYCVHFASAATVLLQATGIPARYVTGYSLDAKAAQITVVRAKDAHAWVEYWLPGYGWTVLEVTPPAPEELPTQALLPEATQPAQQTPTDLAASALDAVLPVLLILTGIAVPAVYIQYLVRLRRRRKRLRTGTPNERALRYWQELTVVKRYLNETPDKDLFALAQKAKFSQHTLTEQELQALTDGYRQALDSLKKRSVFHRLYHRLILAFY